MMEDFEAVDVGAEGGDPLADQDDLEEDPTKCAVCLDGEVYEGNEILFCDKCDVAVHQGCYGVKVVPEGEWFCYPCSEGKDTSTLPCELCSFTGGAYKPTDKSGKWVHPLCAIWIPELYELAGVEPPTFCLAPLDTKRFRLKCVLCNKKGACVQCCYGRCTTAAHPWCVLHEPKGFTKRIVKDDEGYPQWEIFCKAHAGAVTDPVKPRSKRQSFSRNEGPAEVDYFEPPPSKPQATSTVVSLTMSNADQFDAFPSVAGAAGKGRSQTNRKGSKFDRDEDEQKASSFPLLSLLEWPGISEGEGMDLDHFWNYVSSFHPEDHTQEWFTYMTAHLLKPMGWKVDSEAAMQPLHHHDASREDLREQIDEILAALGSERYRSAALNYMKRDELLGRAAAVVSALRSGARRERPGLVSVSSSDHLPNATPDHPYFVDSLEYYLRKNHVGRAARHFADKAHVPDNHTLSVLVDGPQRFLCDFAVDVNEGGVDVTKDPSNPLVHDAKAHVWPIGPHMGACGSVTSVAVRLDSIVAIPTDQQILLPGHHHLISREEDSELNKLIEADQRAYADISIAVHTKLTSVLQSVQWEDLIAHNMHNRKADVQIHELYAKQQTWKHVCTGLVKGMRDQSPDFNKVEFEKPPASWTLEVAGRDVAKGEEEEEQEPHEDSVCMCCFDGTSNDNNKIIYCDGCNAPFHQLCYGVVEIPEGDYFCDRCKHIQAMDDALEDVDDVKDIVKCALCPMYHGGLKPTVCGRWVHLACALWAQGCEITNVVEMTDIEIRNVPVQLARGNRGVGAHQAGVTHSTVDTPCVYCRIPGGYVASCSHVQSGAGGHPCEVAFHPLCAWFAGAHVAATCTDSTFQATSYPSGVKFSLYCIDHSIDRRGTGSSGNGKLLTDEQRTLRNKYCVNIADLNQLPGMLKRKRKKLSKKKEGKMLAGQQVKDLPVDKYDAHTCAYCMLPMSSDIFNCGFNPEKLLLSTNLDVIDGNPMGPSLSGSVGAVESKSDDTDAAPGNEGRTVSETSQSLGGTSGSSSAVVDPWHTRQALELPQPTHLQCRSCGIHIHATCAQEFYGSGWARLHNNWTCYVCESGLDPAQVKCGLCPRHGGLLHFVANQPSAQFMHIYCAKFSLPGVIISATHGIDVKSIPKEHFNKNKCTSCNRKTGMCLPCNSLGCSHHFHPLCGKRNKICIRVRNNFRELYCQEHLPDFVEYLALNPDGYTDHVDLVEVAKFTYTLERSRLIADQLIRREKHKKMLCKAEADLFGAKFHKLLDKAMHRKSSAAGANGGVGEPGDVPMDEVSESELEDEDSEDDYDDLLDGPQQDDARGSYVPLDEDPHWKNVTKVAVAGLGLGPDDDNETLEVNSTWCNYKNELRLPKRIAVTMAGVFSNKFEVLKAPGKVAFHKNLLAEMQAIKDASRPNTGIFVSNKAEEKFLQSLQAFLTKQMDLSDADCTSDLPAHQLHTPGASHRRGTIGTIGGIGGIGTDGKKPKKGYVILDDDDGEDQDLDADSTMDVETPARSRKEAKARRLSDTAEVPVAPPPTAPRRGRPPKSSYVTQAATPAPAPLPIDTPDLPSRKRARHGLAVEVAEEEKLETIGQKPKYAKPKEVMEKLAAPVDALASADYDAIQELLRSSEHQAFSRLFVRPKAGTVGFDSVLQSLDAKVVLPYEPRNLFDEDVYDTTQLYKLERMLQDLLYQIDNATVVVDCDKPAGPMPTGSQAKSTGRPSKKHTQHNSAPDDPEVRYLAEPLQSIPYESIPDYDHYVRRVVTLGSMHECLQKHFYRSMDQFFNDLYTLFNNAKSVTMATSETWKDVKKLASLCEEWRVSVATSPCCTMPRCQERAVQALPIAAVGTPKSGPLLCCGRCKTQHVVRNWPEEFNPPGLGLGGSKSDTPRRATRGSHSKSDDCWQWLCGPCLGEMGLAGQLQGLPVQVWWHDDAVAYRGEVCAFDDASGCPCVVYEDEEWEFVNLTVEPFAIVLASQSSQA